MRCPQSGRLNDRCGDAAPQQQQQQHLLVNLEIDMDIQASSSQSAVQLRVHGEIM